MDVKEKSRKDNIRNSVSHGVQTAIVNNANPYAIEEAVRFVMKDRGVVQKITVLTNAIFDKLTEGES